MRPFFIDPRDIRNLALYAVVCVIVPLGWIVLALVIWRDQYTDYIIYVAGGLAFAGMGIVYWFYDRIPPGSEEALIKKKLAERLASGELLATEKSEPLSQQDIAWLRILNGFLVSTLIITFGVFTLLSYFPAKELAGYPYSVIIPMILGALFAFLIYKYAQRLRRVIAKGEKSVVQGIITDRRRREDDSSREYYLVVGTNELRVSKRDYRTHRVGEVVRIGYVPDFGGMVLRIERL